MGRQHPDKSLENALHRIVKQRTLAALSMKNVAFVLEHQDDTLDDLTEYLRARRMEFDRPPTRSEIIGGDFIEYRFGSWRKALLAIGVKSEWALNARPRKLEETKLYLDEYAAQKQLHQQEKQQKKREKQAQGCRTPQTGCKSRRFQMSGGRGTFDGQHWREELLRKRTKEALERYPAGERRLHYNEEYKRQTLIYNQERDAKKRAKKERYEQRMRKQAEARNQKSAAKAPVTAES